MEAILSINQQGNKTFVLAPNQFTHLTIQEFIDKYLGGASNSAQASSSPGAAPTLPTFPPGIAPPVDASSVLDWVGQGKVSIVKHQLQVSSSFALYIASCVLPEAHAHLHTFRRNSAV